MACRTRLAGDRSPHQGGGLCESGGPGSARGPGRRDGNSASARRSGCAAVRNAAGYAKRVQATKKQYDDAVALLQPQHYQQALKQLDAIAATVPAGYRDLAQRRSEARTALRDESGRQYAAGQQAEQNGDFAAAQQRYERAHELDPSHDVSGDIARLADQKARLGHDACTRAGALYLVGHNTEAAALYNKVVQLLPDTDPVQEAKDRLATIKDR